VNRTDSLPAGAGFGGEVTWRDSGTMAFQADCRGPAALWGETMTIQPVAGLPSIQRRSTADHDLSHLFAEVVTARAAEQLTLSTKRPDDNVRNNSRRLTASLSAYADALEAYRLPVPRAIRDELRLRRRLTS
jgi:hypothetical protein